MYFQKCVGRIQLFYLIGNLLVCTIGVLIRVIILNLNLSLALIIANTLTGLALSMAVKGSGGPEFASLRTWASYKV